MIWFARSVTNSVKSHTPKLKALHSKNTPPQLSASGIRSVTCNVNNTMKSRDIHVPPIFVCSSFMTPDSRGLSLFAFFLFTEEFDSCIREKPGGTRLEPG